MQKYFITYDLNRPGQHYSNLYAAIKSYPNWCHLIESVWIVASDRTAEQIRDHLRQHMDSNDKLWVGGWTGEAAWYGFTAETSQWLKVA